MTAKSEIRLWAKKECLSAINKRIGELKDKPDIYFVGLEELEALERECKRIRRFLGL